MIPGMYNDIRLSQSMLDEADQDTSLEVRSAPGKYAWHIHSLLSCFHADMGKMMWCSHRFCETQGLGVETQGLGVLAKIYFNKL